MPDPTNRGEHYLSLVETALSDDGLTVLPYWNPARKDLGAEWYHVQLMDSREQAVAANVTNPFDDVQTVQVYGYRRKPDTAHSGTATHEGEELIRKIKKALRPLGHVNAEIIDGERITVTGRTHPRTLRGYVDTDPEITVMVEFDLRARIVLT